MFATIALVGRPNVGKSTLFNRFTRSRQALVSNSPGLTRDRQYGTLTLEGQQAIVIDTGGVQKPTCTLETLMYKQTLLALQEAQIIIFLVDAQSGLLPEDENLAQTLRKLNKNVLTVVNKIDGQDKDLAMADFYALGLGKSFAISAEHNLGIAELLHAITENLSAKNITSDEESVAKDAIKITFVGRPNVGKSTLVNCILGTERVVTHNQPGTTRDSIFIEHQYRNKKYVLVDTAGVRRRSRVQERIEKFSLIKTLQAITITDVVVFLIDATENITEQDLKLLGFVLEQGKALVIAVNKWDGLLAMQRTRIKNELSRRLTFLDFVQIHFISALHGTGVGDLFNSINIAYASATRELHTAELNRILAQAINTHQPPLVRGREIKIRYAHAGDRSPPTIIIHGTRVSFLPRSYIRYLEHFFRQRLQLTGTPLKIICKH